AGFSPADLQSAYNLPSSAAGSGQTVAIVDAYDDPNAEADLATYRAQFGIASCTTANGCFRKVNQTGGSIYPSADAGWAGEISLDLDMVSAICPNCHILLVEAASIWISDPGIAITVASGDTGYGVEYPAASPDVTAVGGTSLSPAANSRGWSESVWHNL